MILSQNGKPWLDPNNAQRMAQYGLYRRLYKAQKISDKWYLGSRWASERRRIMIIINFPGLITRACADLLFGEPPTFAANDDANDDLQAIIKRNLFLPECFQSELACSYRGDAVFRARMNDENELVVETIPAHNYYIEPSNDDCRYAEAEIIAWVTYAVDGTTPIIKMQRHTDGLVQEMAFLAIACDDFSSNGTYGEKMVSVGMRDNCNWKIGDRVSLDFAYKPGQVPVEELHTGVKETIVEHIPNFEDDEQYWGVSDYHDLTGLFEGANNRISNIDSYLDIHSRPKLIGSPGMADMEGNFDMGTDYIEPMNPEIGGTLPRYLVWDGAMESAFAELQYLEKKIFQISEMSQAIFGIDIATSVDSSMAMRQFFTRTKAKINRKRMIYDQRLKNFLQRAMEFAHNMGATNASGDGLIKFPSAIEIQWQDGIPRDYVEQVTAEATRRGSELTSLESSIMRIDMCSKEAARAEIDKIKAENAEGIGGVAARTDVQPIDPALVQTKKVTPQIPQRKMPSNLKP